MNRGSRSPHRSESGHVADREALGRPESRIEPSDTRQSTLPLTGARVVDLIITDLCVLACGKDGSGRRLVELASGVTADEVRAKTAAQLGGLRKPYRYEAPEQLFMVSK
jgi:acyl CoA:acetate/3-ketoacid CoA transferase beta subunit